MLAQATFAVSTPISTEIETASRTNATWNRSSVARPLITRRAIGDG